jgi:hypothetical protein
MDFSVVILIAIASAALWGAFALNRRPKRDPDAGESSPVLPGSPIGAAGWPHAAGHCKLDGDRGSDNDGGGGSGGD